MAPGCLAALDSETRLRCGRSARQEIAAIQALELLGFPRIFFFYIFTKPFTRILQGKFGFRLDLAWISAGFWLRLDFRLILLWFDLDLA